MTERKRGRPRKAPSGKTAGFSTRIEPALREALERDSKEHGRSLTETIEIRLNQSFNLDAEIRRREQAFGGPQNYAALRIIAEVIRNIDAATGRRWTEDPWTYAQVEQAIVYLLHEWRPSGELVKAAVPRFAPDEADRLGAHVARGVLFQVDFAEPQDAHVFARIKNDLGDLAGRGRRPHEQERTGGST